MAVGYVEYDDAVEQVEQDQALMLKASKIVKRELETQMAQKLDAVIPEFTEQTSKELLEAAGQPISDEAVKKMLAEPKVSDDLVDRNLRTLGYTLAESWKNHLFEAARDNATLGVELVPESFVNDVAQGVGGVDDFNNRSLIPADELSEEFLRQFAAEVAAEVKDRLLAGDSAIFEIDAEALGDGTYKLSMRA